MSRPEAPGYTRQIEADTIIFAIGDTVDKDFCVPIFNDAYLSAPQPRFPVEGISFEAYQSGYQSTHRTSFPGRAGRARPAPDWLGWRAGMVKELPMRSCNSSIPEDRCVIWIMWWRNSSSAWWRPTSGWWIRTIWRKLTIAENAEAQSLVWRISSLRQTMKCLLQWGIEAENRLPVGEVFRAGQDNCYPPSCILIGVESVTKMPDFR